MSEAITPARSLEYRMDEAAPLGITMRCAFGNLLPSMAALWWSAGSCSETRRC
jgi:hypothetical protein